MCGEEQIIFHEEKWNSGLSEKPEKMMMADVFAPELLHLGVELMVLHLQELHQVQVILLEEQLSSLSIFPFFLYLTSFYLFLCSN